MKIIISFLLIISLTAQADEPKVSPSPSGTSGLSNMSGMNDSGMGSAPMSFRPSGSIQMPLPETRSESSTCTFKMGDEVSADDRLLLSSARNMAQTLRNNSEQCAAATADTHRAFEASVQDYNGLNDADRPVNPNSQMQATCSNYERFYDIQYDQFLNTWENRDVNDIFNRCRGQERESALTCAQGIVSSQRVQRHNQCETTREFISAQRNQQLQVQTFTTGMAYLQSIINNDQCVGEDGAQRMNLLQSAVSLASRAATVSLAGSPLGMLVGGVTSLLQSAIGRLFRGRDPYLADQNQQNFERVACLYEQIESRSRRCERDSAEQYVLREQGRFNTAVQACEAAGGVEAPLDLIRNISSVVGRYNSSPVTTGSEGAAALAPEGSSISQFSDEFNGLMERMITPTSALGRNDTPMAIGLQSAQDVVANLDAILAEREPSPNLDNYIQAKNGNQAITNPARNRERQRLRVERDRAENLRSLLTVMNEVGSSSDQTPADLERVQVAMREFNGGDANGVSQNFAGAFNQVLSMKSEFTDDLAERINNWRNRLSEYQVHKDTVNRFNEQRRRMNASYDDDRAFQNQIDTLRPYLKDQMDSEMSRLQRLAGGIQSSPDLTRGRNVRQTDAENILWPMVRACNLLQSVGTESDVCGKLTCQNGNGVRSFAQYLQSQEQDARCTPASCREQFNTYVCKNKSPGFTESIGQRLKNEYVNSGTICGRPWIEVFGRR